MNQSIDHPIDQPIDQSIPLHPPQVTASTTQTIPAGAPPITLEVAVQGTDTNGSALTCLETKVQFASQGGLSAEEMEARPAISSTLLAEIAMAPESRTWSAHWSPRFANATLRQAARLMGTVLKDHPMHLRLPEKPLAAFRRGPNDSIPAHFDARDAWPQCRAVIGHIRDQSACGSCWAVASSESFNDRLCIARNFTALLSPTDTMACCAGASCGFSQGCNGGQPAGAWSYFTSAGIVTGGDYPDVRAGGRAWIRGVACLLAVCVFVTIHPTLQTHSSIIRSARGRAACRTRSPAARTTWRRRRRCRPAPRRTTRRRAAA